MRLVVMISLMVGILLVIGEPYEIVVVGYLKVSSHCYNGALERYS